MFFLQNLFVDIIYVNEVAGQDDASKTVSNEIRIQHYKLKFLSIIIDLSYNLVHENCNCFSNFNRSNKLLRKSYPLHLKTTTLFVISRDDPYQ